VCPSLHTDTYPTHLDHQLDFILSLFGFMMKILIFLVIIGLYGCFSFNPSPISSRLTSFDHSNTALETLDLILRTQMKSFSSFRTVNSIYCLHKESESSASILSIKSLADGIMGMFPAALDNWMLVESNPTPSFVKRPLLQNQLKMIL
jgi:hypothetical protein